MKWDTPILEEMLDFDRTKLTLPIKKVAIKSSDKKLTIKAQRQNELILSYVRKNGKISTSDAAELLHIGAARARVILSQMSDIGELIPQGKNKTRVYVIKQ